MNSSQPLTPLHWRLIAAALVLYLLHTVYAVVSNRFFYPDGTQYFVHIIATANYADWLWPRYFADHLLQFPVVSGVRAGMTNIEHLGWLRGASLLLPPLISLAVCYLAAPRDRKYLLLIPLLSHFGAAVNTEFFMHTANRLLESCAWAVAFLVLFRRGGFALALAAVVAAPMLRIYEGVMIPGTVLALLCGWKARQETGGRRVFLWALAVWFVVCAVTGARFVFKPNDPTSFLTFAAGVLAIADENLYPNMPALVSLLVLAVAGLWQWRPRRFEARKETWFRAALAACALLLLCPLLWPRGIAPETHLQMRALNVYVPAALMIVLWGAEAGWWRWRDDLWRPLAVLVAALGIAQSGWNIQATAQWNRYVAVFRSELQRLPAGLVRFQDTRLAELPERYGISAGMHCDWSAAQMSILFAPEKSVRTIIAHSYDNIYKPMDPRNPADLPDFSRFGYDYAPYLAALAKQGPVEIPRRPFPPWLEWLDVQFNRRIKGGT